MSKPILAITMIVAMCVTVSAQPTSEARARAAAEKLIKQSDKNHDGKLSRDEFPEQLQGAFDRVDVNRDGFVDLEEDVKFRIARDREQPNRQPQQQLPDGFVAQRDIEYARAGDKSLLLDVYAPKESKESRPLIVWVHGGGWRNGSKDRCPALRFLEKGFVVASINYRLSHEAIFPAQIQDFKAAIRWLRANAKQHHIDPDRIGVWGSSAGGHLVALLGTSGDVKVLEGDSGHNDKSSRVQAVCDFFGPTDLLQMDAHALATAPFKHDAPDSPESKLIGGPIQENKEKTSAANPIKYVTSDDPPFLIIHGDQDPLVPMHQSEMLHKALTKAAVAATFHTVKGAGHGFGSNSEVDRLVDEFFHEKLEGLLTR